MKFDLVTLMAAGSITTTLGGALLIAMWFQLRHATALLWWSSAYFTYALGIAFLMTGLPNGHSPSLLAGSLLADTAPPLIWVGVRVFNRRHTSAIALSAAIAAWLALDAASLISRFGPLVSFSGWAIWLSVAGFELWRGRDERIPARWPLLAFFAVHGLVYAGGIYDVLSGNFPLDKMPALNSWFGLIFFEGMVYAMGSAISMALLCKERDTLKYMRAAYNDSLTGIANHGSFLESAERLFVRCRKDGAPYSLIMFDLDHFKDINDIHGHRVGDNVLRAFADTVRGLLRPNDLFGRYGGEEFTVVLPAAGIKTAYVIAERVRAVFADTHRFLDGQPLNATVSAGVSTAAAGMTLPQLVDAADRALYRAKHLGRNRVERDEDDAGASDNVVRVA